MDGTDDTENDRYRRAVEVSNGIGEMLRATADEIAVVVHDEDWETLHRHALRLSLARKMRGIRA